MDGRRERGRREGKRGREDREGVEEEAWRRRY